MIALPHEEPATPELSRIDAARRLTLGELEDAVWAADPTVCFVLPRILRRIIKQDRRLTGFGLKIPHRKCMVIARESLLQIVDRSEWDMAEDGELPERVLLLASPTARKLAATSAADLLVGYWRLLFHVRLHAELERCIRVGTLTEGEVRRRIHRIGTAEFEESRTVLGQEDMLLPPRDDVSAYVEFVAVYLELRFFTASFLPHYFPGLHDRSALDAFIAQDVDVERIFHETRPADAPSPDDVCPVVDLIDLPAEMDAEAVSPEPFVIHPSEATYRRLMRKSQRPASLGNVVRAALYHARAERCAPPNCVDRVRTAIKMDMYRLIRRLQTALELDDASPQPWQESLYVLVRETANGVWTAEAKLLYDLQKVCIDHEREIYTVDLMEWAISLGRRPLKRLLPNQRDVLMLKHLRSAARRLGSVRISPQQRAQLAHLIHDAMEQVASRLRKKLRPQIANVLEGVGLAAWNMPERVARMKLIEELLDHVEGRGYLTMGDLRDAISRNKLKLPDLAEPREFLRGDPLLRADRKLAIALDGVYRGGEFYLRWMQRISSLAFGTDVGRVLTRFVFVPFGGAYLALAGVHHVWELFHGAKTASADESIVQVATQDFRLTSPTAVLLLGMVILGLINSSAFRRTIAEGWKRFCRGITAVLIEPIRRFLLSPWLQRLIHSRLFSITIRFGVKPLVWTWICWMFLPKESWHTTAETLLATFLAFNLLLNSRLGRTLEEIAADWIVQSWHRFGLRLITGVFWWIIDLFKWWLQTVERLMYSVDEWLRFKSGDRAVAQAAKAVLGFVWFFIAYVLRFCVNVLIEPQINPIKHFPVVTVSHKLLLPLIPTLAYVLEITLDKPLAWTVAATTIWSIPGIFGFLVWELKENWRLYAANRPRYLASMPIGTHGETMARLLKPGFHSGTLPKRYAKLRHAERRSRVTGQWTPVRKHLLAIDGVELAIRRFIEREFLELFSQSKCWQGPAVTLNRLETCTNGVRAFFGWESAEQDALWQIRFFVESGWLVADMPDSRSIDRLPPHQRHVLETAITGLYQSMGIELVRQQIEDQFPRPMPWYDITTNGLTLWPDGAEDVEVHYDLHDEAWIAPQSIRGLSSRTLPTLPRRQLVFAETLISWDDWVIVWNQETIDLDRPLKAVSPVCILPRQE